MSSPGEIRDRLGPLVDREGGALEGWAERLSTFLNLLEARNRAVNLVSRKTAGEALERHVLPSLAALLVVPPSRPLRVLDVGAGGGFPGIPLKILRPAIRLDLVEATGKKARFLELCVEELGLQDTRVHWCRIEDPAADLQGRAPFDRVLARAVGDDELLVASSRPLLAPGAEVWVFARPGEEGVRDWVDGAGQAVTALRRLV